MADSTKYLLVGDQMLFFGTLLPNSLINPNQLRAYGLHVHNDPFNSTCTFGINSDNAFIPFKNMGTVVHFESCTPAMEWEKVHLPMILLTSEEWNPTNEVLRAKRKSWESIEMRTIQSFTSGMMKRQVSFAMKMDKAKTPMEQYGETEVELGKISNVYNVKDFCDHLISSVHIATTYRDDVDQWDNERKVSSLISNERHSKATPEECYNATQD
jgi:hypothetical protein